MACSVSARHCLASGCLAVIARGAGVEIPTKVIETSVWVGDESANVSGRFLFKIMKADHNIGHLYAGVVDVVLHFDIATAVAQHADERVAQNGVAQVADVRGFVGVDVGVFHHDLFAGVGYALIPRPAANWRHIRRDPAAR